MADRVEAIHAWGIALAGMARFAQYLIILTLLTLLFVFVARFPNHFSDPTWPVHAKAHLFSQLSIGAGVCLAALIVSIRFFRPRRAFVWWALLGVGIFIFGGYWAGKLLMEPDTAWRSGNTIFAVMTLSYSLGLCLSWRYFLHRRQES